MGLPEGARPSVRDVAERAGVSVGTVSHVLNHPDRVAGSTRERVQAVIAELGFIPSGAARQLRKRASRAVGLAVLDIANPFYTEAARAVEDALDERGYSLVMSSTDANPDRERRVLETMVGQEVAGLICTPSAGTHENLVVAQGRGTPIVLLDSPEDRSFSSVGVDDVAGGQAAVAHLLASGHRSIAVISGPPEVRQAADRWRGASQAVRDAGLDPRRVLVRLDTDSFHADAGAGAMALLLEQRQRPTATFAFSDTLAIGAMRTLRAAGVAVPDAMALVGYDDISVASELVTPLTTIRQPMRRLGHEAVQLLFSSPTPQHVLLEPQLICRASAP